MKKLVSLSLLVALTLAACTGSGAVAATVDGVDISVGDVEGLIHSEDATIEKDRFAEFLGFEIQRVILEGAALSEYGVEVTDDAIQARTDELFEEGKIEGENREDFVATRGVTEEFLRNFAQYELISEQVRTQMASELPAPSAEQIADQMNAAQWGLTTVCASHILLETEEEAQAALDRVTGGEDFATVAVEASTGPSGPTGGDLGCTTPMDYVPEFRDATLNAPIGEVYETIVATFFGFHVILVTERTEPEASALPSEDDIVETMNLEAASNIFNPWLLGQLTGALVEVVERFGTWQTEPQPQVVPPTE